MNDLGFNKIFAALLVAGIVASLSGFISRSLVHPKELEQDAIAVEGVETVSGGAAVATAEPILALLASADPARGQTLTKTCAACHNFEKGGPNGLGPNLWGVVGRHSAAHEGFDYSAAMKEKNIPWDYDHLNHFLWKPKSYVAGTKMNFIGLKKPEDRAAVIAYLRTLSDTPAALPTKAEIAAEAADAPAAEGETETPAEAAAQAQAEEADKKETQAGQDKDDRADKLNGDAASEETGAE